MSIGQTFPDVIVLGNDRYQLVTRDAKSWLHCNAPAYDYEDVERVLTITGDNIPEWMADDGLVVLRRRRPKPPVPMRGCPPSKENVIDSEDEFDRHRAMFEGLTVEEYRRQTEMCRAYGRHRAENWRLMQERDERRKKSDLPEEKHDEI